MLIKTLGVLAVLAIVFVAIASKRPSEFHITRSIAINAPAPVVFAQVNDLHKWEAWSPWAKMDPNAKSSYEGPAAGVGAKMSWAGNMKVGEGSMTITESRPNQVIRFNLDFLKPLAGHNTAEFAFQPQGHETLVHWSMAGRNNFAAKVMSVFMDCDKMVGDQFDKGLASLKSVAESSPKK